MEFKEKITETEDSPIDKQMAEDYIPFFTQDELEALGINAIIEKQNKSNIVHQRVRLEDYVNFSLIVSGRSNVIKTTQISDYFHKDPKSKQFVYTEKYKECDFDLDKNKNLKTFLDEAKYLLTVHSSEYTGGKTFLDFTYRDIVRSEAFETYLDRKSDFVPKLDKMRTVMPTAMEAIDVFGEVAETEMKRKDGEKKAPEAQKKLHEAIRHNIVLNGIIEEFGSYTLEDTVNRSYSVYYDNITKNKKDPIPAPYDDNHKSVFSSFGERAYTEYTYSAVVLLDKKGMESFTSTGTADEKHSPTGADRYRADFRYSTEQSNVPLFQSEDEYKKYHSVYAKSVNNLNAYKIRYNQLANENSHTYFTVEGKPFVMPPPPEKLLQIARQDSAIISLVQKRDEILENAKVLFKEEFQKTRECAGECLKALHAKAKTTPLKSGEMYSEYIESAKDWWKKDTDLFESLVKDRIAKVREECERRNDKCYAQITVLAKQLEGIKSPNEEENEKAIKYYCLYRDLNRELKKQLAYPEPEAKKVEELRKRIAKAEELYKPVIEKGKQLYTPSLFLDLYVKDNKKCEQTLKLLQSAEEKLNAMQEARGTTETKEATVEMPEQTGGKQNLQRNGNVE